MKFSSLDKKLGSTMKVLWSGASLCAFVAILAGCAGSPRALSKMSADELRAVTDRQLCAAYASYTVGSSRKDIPAIRTEVKRRGLGCAEEIDVRKNDCSELAIVRVDSDPRYSNVKQVTVRNSSAKAKRFIVHDPNGVYGKTKVLAAKSTTTYNIASSAETQKAAATASAIGLNAAAERGTWGFMNCYTER